MDRESLLDIYEWLMLKSYLYASRKSTRIVIQYGAVPINYSSLQ